MDIEKEELKSIPVWAHLKIALKYWAEKSLHRIYAQSSDPIKRDEATRNRDKLQFARILIEMNIEGKFPSKIHFRNENEQRIEVIVEYEWTPMKCSVCSAYGHEAKEFRVQNMKKIWVPKQVQHQVTVPFITDATHNLPGVANVNANPEKQSASSEAK